MTPAARERWRVRLPVLLVTAGAWTLTLAGSIGKPFATACCPLVIPASSSSPLRASVTWQWVGLLAGQWLLMLVAMMGPMLAMPIRHVLDRSFHRRRRRAVLLFVGGYIAVWMAAGGILLALITELPRSVTDWPALGASLVAVAICWQCSPFKQACLNRGHSHGGLAAFGIPAELETLGSGLVHGVWCVGSCWALMLVPYALGGGAHLAAMAGVAAWLLAEKLERPTPTRWRLRAPAKAGRIALARARLLFRPG